MKKSIAALVATALLFLMLAGCSSHLCPTYSKAAPAEKSNGSRG